MIMNSPKLTFAYWEKTVDKSEILSLDIGEWHSERDLSRTDSLQGKLIIEGYSELVDFFAGNCNLKKLIIRNCPKLKNVYAGANKIKEVDINCPSLKSLNLNHNELENIDNVNAPSLRTLVISNNHLKGLEYINIFFNNLETLHCFNNHLWELDCSGMKKLEDVNCSWNTPSYQIIKEVDKNTGEVIEWKTWKLMISLKLDECTNLKKVDADMNALEDLSFTSQLPNLEEISLRDNKTQWFLDTRKDETKSDSYLHNFPETTKTVYFDSPVLKRVNIINSDIKEIISNKRDLKEVEIIDDETDEGYLSSSEDTPTKYEQSAYEDLQAKQKKDFEEGKHTYQGQTHLDLSGCDFINSITIDGDIDYPKSLDSINLGGNCLSEVIIRNLPNLVRLIVSHNSKLIKGKTLIIENCPKLKLLYDYKSADKTKIVPVDAREYDEKKDNPLRKDKESSQPQPTKDKETPSVQESAPPQQNPWPLLIISSTLIGGLVIGFYLLNKLVKRLRKASE
ncbi:MAG: hypothetical protein mread185_000318 [Mycoplasmataceae bacterium]|nr:MAG: hypothetical protein mread185_000318 [Mycoplasmataceae bacterium]